MRLCNLVAFFFFFKQKTAYEMRISDWSSDVCSSDLEGCPESTECKLKTWLPNRLCAGPLQYRISKSSTPSSPMAFMRISGASGGRSHAKLVWMLTPIISIMHSAQGPRSEERRVGKEWVSTWRSRWSPYN